MIVIPKEAPRRIRTMRRVLRADGGIYCQPARVRSANSRPSVTSIQGGAAPNPLIRNHLAPAEGSGRENERVGSQRATVCVSSSSPRALPHRCCQTSSIRMKRCHPCVMERCRSELAGTTHFGADRRILPAEPWEGPGRSESCPRHDWQDPSVAHKRLRIGRSPAGAPKDDKRLREVWQHPPGKQRACIRNSEIPPNSTGAGRTT
jgi:hypothetical protein